MCPLAAPCPRGGNLNGWTIAEWVGDRSPDATQRLLNRARWDTAGAMSAVRHFAVARLDAAARPASLTVGVLDESGQEKKGAATAGVKRQHMGCAGGIDNGINTVHLLDQAQVRLYEAILRHTVLVMAALAICAVSAADAPAPHRHPGPAAHQARPAAIHRARHDPADGRRDQAPVQRRYHPHIVAGTRRPLGQPGDGGTKHAPAGSTAVPVWPRHTRSSANKWRLPY
ncbi:transposase [Streptosporangium sp. NPDC000563]|uniref:transposase n=1 Tax=Streptosporangium sp. NPDC000563 TaxID=3154366 RepID=UPI0033327753